jgi:hypothetical protein
MFGSMFNKVKSPTTEKKEADLLPVVPAKDTIAAESVLIHDAAKPVPEVAKPLEEAQVAVPVTMEPVTEPSTLKADDAKVASPISSTPVKEKEHFSFGRLFSGASKDRSKSPAATDKSHVSEPSKVDDVAPKIQDPVAPTPAVEPVVVAPVSETTVAAPATPAKDETPKKRGSIFGTLGRSLSKATKSTGTPKENKTSTSTPTTVPEATEPAVLAGEKDEVVPEAVSVGEAPKSTPAVSSTA